MEDKEQSLHEEMLFRIMKVAEILAKSSEIDARLIKQSLLQNKSTNKFDEKNLPTSKTHS